MNLTTFYMAVFVSMFTDPTPVSRVYGRRLTLFYVTHQFLDCFYFFPLFYLMFSLHIRRDVKQLYFANSTAAIAWSWSSVTVEMFYHGGYMTNRILAMWLCCLSISITPRFRSSCSLVSLQSSTSFNRDVVKAGTGRRFLGGLLDDTSYCYTLEVSFYSYMTVGSTAPVPYTEETCILHICSVHVWKQALSVEEAAPCSAVCLFYTHTHTQSLH